MKKSVLVLAVFTIVAALGAYGVAREVKAQMAYPTVTQIGTQMGVYSADGQTDQGIATFQFKVTADGSDVFLSRHNLADLVDVYYSGSNIGHASSATLISSGINNSTPDHFLVEEGESVTFTLTAMIDPTRGSGQYRAQLTHVLNANAPGGQDIWISNFLTQYVALRGWIPVSNTCYQFNTNLQLGSQGADVAALQMFLISIGLDIPAISSGNMTKGTFEQQTISAVREYQALVGIPNTGFVGPLTRGAINGSCTPSPTVIGPGIGVYFATTTPNSLVARWNSASSTQRVDVSLIDGASMKAISPYVFNNLYTGQHFGFNILPNSVPEGSYMIRVCSANTLNCGFSSSFQVASTYSTVRIISPNGGETIHAGDTYTIRWQSSGLDTVNINLFNDALNSRNTIASQVPASQGRNLWKVPNITSSDKYTIAIGKNNIGDVTDSTFSIAPVVQTPKYTVNIIPRLNGTVVGSSQLGSCAATLSGPSGNDTGGCARTLTNQQAGMYTLKWQSGYPSGADTTRSPSVTPSLRLGDYPAGGTSITFYIDFAAADSQTTSGFSGTVNVVTRVDGSPLSSTAAGSCVATVKGPKGNNTAGCVRTLTNQAAGSYSLQWNGGFPPSATPTKPPTATTGRTLGNYPDGDNPITLYLDFAPVATSTGSTFSGTVNVVTRVNGNPLPSAATGNCVTTLKGPSGSNTGGCVRTIPGQSAGTYSITWNGRYPNPVDGLIQPPKVTITPARYLGSDSTPVTFYLDFESDNTPDIYPEFVSAQTDVVAGTSSNDDTGTFQIKFKVQALNSDLYLPTGADSMLDFKLERNGSPITNGVIGYVLNNNGMPVTPAGNYKIEEGSSHTFTLIASVQLPAAGLTGQYRMLISGIRWGTEDDVVAENVHSVDSSVYRTDYRGLNYDYAGSDFAAVLQSFPTGLSASLWETFKSYIRR